MAIAKVESALLEELTSRILAAIEPLRIVLFGSAVDEHKTFAADLDVLIVVENGTSTRAKAQEVYRKLVGFGYPVDVVVVTTDELERNSDNPNLIYSSALQQGVDLYVKR